MEGRTYSGIAAPAFELGRDDPGVVENEHIARSKFRGKLGHCPVRDSRAADDQHSRGIPRRGWPQRDPVRRQIEIE
jgi:hypothetical protein